VLGVTDCDWHAFCIAHYRSLWTACLSCQSLSQITVRKAFGMKKACAYKVAGRYFIGRSFAAQEMGEAHLSGSAGDCK